MRGRGRWPAELLKGAAAFSGFGGLLHHADVHAPHKPACSLQSVRLGGAAWFEIPAACRAVSRSNLLGQLRSGIAGTDNDDAEERLGKDI
jgi:hypothetical protein